MAKDPAFLFYPNDWLGGTMGLTRHHKGCYIDLLIAQFNNGPLSNEVIKTVLGQDQAIWTVLQSKFKQNPQGHFYNERLANEIEKRKNFSDSRRKNISNRYKKPTSVDTSVLHMENENRNENAIREEGGAGEETIGLSPDGFFSDKIDKKIPLPKTSTENTVEYISIMCKKKISEPDVGNYWEAFKIQQLQKHQWYNSFADMVSHFRDFLKNQINKLNGNTTTSTVGKTIEFDRP